MCRIQFPSSLDREWSCPVSYPSVGEGFSADAPLSSVTVDVSKLPTIISSGADLCLIVTQRVNGIPYHRCDLVITYILCFPSHYSLSYFCNGEASKSTAHETWSSSKIFAMANAAGNLRQQCANAGIDSSTSGYFTPLSS
jgi:hypothetical protein